MEDSTDSSSVSSCSIFSDPHSYESGEPNEKRKKVHPEGFKYDVLNVLRQVTAGDFSISGKLENSPLVVISLKVKTVVI